MKRKDLALQIGKIVLIGFGRSDAVTPNRIGMCLCIHNSQFMRLFTHSLIHSLTTKPRLIDFFFFFLAKRTWITGYGNAEVVAISGPDVLDLQQNNRIELGIREKNQIWK